MTSQLDRRPTTPPRRATPRPRRRPGSGLVAGLLLVLVAAVTLMPLRPTSAAPASAPGSQFSADRAQPLVQDLAATPRPAGTAAADAARERIVAALQQLDLQTDDASAVTGRTPAGDLPVVATVANVHARIPGTDPTGRVLLVAHYDSVPTGPGAADNAANVAAVVEVARALLAGPRPRNDVDLLLTGGEEEGLLGARAFLESGAAGDPGRVVVVNLDARGVSGPAVLFQAAGPGMAPTVRAADPVTTSLADAIFHRLPNDTDLTAFEDAGMRGVNIAHVGGAAHYHTPHDDLEHLSHDTVQSMGEAALGAARELGAADLGRSGPTVTFFSVPGGVVTYPSALVLPFALVALAAVVAAGLVGRRHGLRLRGVARGVVAVLALVPAAAAVGVGGWRLIVLLRPEEQLTFGTTYWPTTVLVAEAAVLLAVTLLAHGWARKRAGADEVLLAVLGCFAVFAVALALLLPGGAYLLTWPALVGAVPLAVRLRTGRAGPIARLVPVTAAGATALLLLLPVAALLAQLPGNASGAVPLVVLALLGTLLVPVLDPRPRRLRTAGASVLLGAGGVGVLVGVAVFAGHDAARPRPVSLAYLYEADADRASWLSLGGPDQPQVGGLLTDTVRLGERVPPLGYLDLSTGPVSRPGDTTAPSIEVLEDEETDAGRSVRLRVRAAPEAHTVYAYVETTRHQVLSAEVDGRPVAGGANSPDHVAAGWDWGFRYVAPPDAGVDVRLDLAGTGPVRIRLLTVEGGLPADGDPPVLDPSTSWTPWPMLPAETYVVRTVRV